MPQIFHPAFNTVSRVSIFGAVFMIAGAVVIAGVIVRSPYTTEVGVVRVQPIPFSHEHHVGECGIDCRYCHQTVETSASAGLPSTDVCLDCHSQLWSDSPMLAPVHESFRNGTPLRWTRVHDLPDFVYFHHGIHVQKGIDCAECHGEVDEMTLMYREETLHMEWCLQCHRDPHERLSETLNLRIASSATTADSPAGSAGSRVIDLQSKMNCSICHR